MSDANNVISVKVLGRTYQIKCPADEAADLQESARYLNEQMQHMNHSGNANNTERLAIIAALNIAHEFMMLKKQKNDYIDVMSDQIKSLQYRIQKFLGTKESISV